MKTWDNFSSKFPKGVNRSSLFLFEIKTYTLKNVGVMVMFLKCLRMLHYNYNEFYSYKRLWNIRLWYLEWRGFILWFRQNCDLIPALWLWASFLIFLSFEFLTFKNNTRFQECYEEQWGDIIVPCKELLTQCMLIFSIVSL